MIGGILMKTLIKKMRELAGMTQEQFAKELSTTPVSINRWENGKSIPRKLTMYRFEKFCKENNITIE